MLQEAVDAFNGLRSNLSPYTDTKYESVLGLVVGFVGSETPIADVTTKRIQVFLDNRARKPVAKEGGGAPHKRDARDRHPGEQN